MSVSFLKKKIPPAVADVRCVRDITTRLFARRCEEAGKYRAPKHLTWLDGLFSGSASSTWREYNLQVETVFDGTHKAELNAQQSKDKCGERTHQAACDPEARALGAFLGTIEDPHQAAWAKTRRRTRQGAPPDAAPPPQNVARWKSSSQGNLSKPEVRRPYKALIKVLHPDMNGG